MAIYAVGNTPADFTGSNTSYDGAAVYNTSFNDTRTSGSNRPGGYTSVAGRFQGRFNIELSQAVSDVWVSFYMKTTKSPMNGITPLTLDDDGTPILRWYTVTGGIQVDLWAGTAWVTVIPLCKFAPTSGARFDIHFKLHDTLGEIEIYVDSALAGSFYGDTKRSSNTTVDALELADYYYLSFITSIAYYSQILVQSESTLGKYVIYQQPTDADPFYAGQDSGGLTDVNENHADTVDDSTLMVFSVANSKASFRTEHLNSALSTLSTGWVVLSVVSSVRAASGLADIVNSVSPMVRTGTGVDAFASSSSATGPAFSAAFEEFPTNPDTGLQWTLAEANAAAIGVEIGY